jgi:hypothetical protein
MSSEVPGTPFEATTIKSGDPITPATPVAAADFVMKSMFRANFNKAAFGIAANDEGVRWEISQSVSKYSE